MDELSEIQEVGYGKPPIHTQFQKGKSGNPKGRPKGSKNFATILDKVGRERITVTENGRRRTITKKEAVATQLMNQSASGDLRAIHVCTHLMITSEGTDPTSESSVPDERDRAAMANILKRIRLLAEAGNEAGPVRQDSSAKEGK